MSLKKFLKTMETMRGGSFIERAAFKFITGTCKVAGFFLDKSSKIGRDTGAQVFIEYLMLLVVLSLFTIVFTSGSFFTRFRSNMDDTMEFAMNTMEQPDLEPPTTSTTGVTIPWWEEEIEEGGPISTGSGVVW